MWTNIQWSAAICFNNDNLAKPCVLLVVEHLQNPSLLRCPSQIKFLKINSVSTLGNHEYNTCHNVLLKAYQELTNKGSYKITMIIFSDVICGVLERLTLQTPWTQSQQLLVRLQKWAIERQRHISHNFRHFGTLSACILCFNTVFYTGSEIKYNIQ